MHVLRFFRLASDMEQRITCSVTLNAEQPGVVLTTGVPTLYHMPKEFLYEGTRVALSGGCVSGMPHADVVNNVQGR